MPAPTETTQQAPTVIDLSSPLRWLRLGWQDLIMNPMPGLLHGAVLAIFGALLFWLAQDQFWWLVGALSGFLLVAPILATGLYVVSRAAAMGEKIGWREVIGLWLAGERRLIIFGVLLALAGTGWVLTSAALITLWAPQPIEKPMDFLRHVVLAPEFGLFEVWVLLGAMLAAPVFASSVVTLPMLVDSEVPLWHAVRQSWRAVANHPAALACWALLIAALVGIGLASLMLGLILVLPVLGHASWHAYAELKRCGSISVAVV